MIPIGDVIPTRVVPFVAIAVVAVQAVAVGHLAFDASLVHAAANAGCLWICGRPVEDRLGHVRFVVFVALSGASGVLADRAFALGVPVHVMAAVGGVAGVMGGYFVLFPESRLVAIVPSLPTMRVTEVPAVVLPCVWFLLQFALGPGPAAVAALLAGGALVRVFRRPERMRVEWWDEAHAARRAASSPSGRSRLPRRP
jgi:membrane associated rhomboid family serine protease